MIDVNRACLIYRWTGRGAWCVGRIAPHCDPGDVPCICAQGTVAFPDDGRGLWTAIMMRAEEPPDAVPVAYLRGPFPSEWSERWTAIRAAPAPRRMPVLWAEWSVRMPNPCPWSHLMADAEATVATLARRTPAPVLGPRHTAVDTDRLVAMEAHHRTRIECDRGTDVNAVWYSLGLAHLCGLDPDDTAWIAIRDTCLRPFGSVREPIPREESFVRERLRRTAAATATLSPATYELSTLRGSKAAILIAMLSATIRTLANAGCTFLLCAGGGTPPAGVRTSAPHLLEEAERMARSGIVRTANATRCIVAALETADSAVARRWHCYANEIERMPTHLTLYEQAEVEKTFLWARTTIIRCQILVLGALRAFLPDGRDDLTAEHSDWCHNACSILALSL